MMAETNNIYLMEHGWMVRWKGKGARSYQAIGVYVVSLEST